MGKTVILASDGPGFLVNRCGRPVRRGGAAAPPGAGGHPRADRPDLPPRRGLPDGPVRADGPRRGRRGLRGGEVVHRALVRRAALEAEPDPVAHGCRRDGWAGRPAAGTTTIRTRGRTGPKTRSRASRAAATGQSVPIVGEGPLASGLRERADAAGFDVSEDGSRAAGGRRSRARRRAARRDGLSARALRRALARRVGRAGRGAASTSCRRSTTSRLAELTRYGTPRADRRGGRALLRAPRTSTPSGWPTPRDSCSAGSSASS